MVEKVRRLTLCNFQNEVHNKIDETQRFTSPHARYIRRH